jgi:hypothetical protein
VDFVSRYNEIDWGVIVLGNGMTAVTQGIDSSDCASPTKIAKHPDADGL